MSPVATTAQAQSQFHQCFQRGLVLGAEVNVRHMQLHRYVLLGGLLVCASPFGYLMQKRVTRTFFQCKAGRESWPEKQRCCWQVGPSYAGEGFGRAITARAQRASQSFNSSACFSSSARMSSSIRRVVESLSVNIAIICL